MEIKVVSTTIEWMGDIHECSASSITASIPDTWRYHTYKTASSLLIYSYMYVVYIFYSRDILDQAIYNRLRQ